MKFIAGFERPSISKNELLESIKQPKCEINNAVQDLFLCLFWGRVWILQELATAPSVQIRCGNHVASLEAFETFLETVNANIHTVANFMSITKAYRLLELAKLYRENLNGKQRLIDILWNTVELEASDQRDKIYAILSIAREDDQNALPPVYNDTKTSEGLLCNIVRHHLENEGDLDIFCYFPPLHPVSPNHCSWLPDLSKHINGICPQSFTASADAPPNFRFSSDKKTLADKRYYSWYHPYSHWTFHFSNALEVSLESGLQDIFNRSSLLPLKDAVLGYLQNRSLPSINEEVAEAYFWDEIVGDNIVLGADGPNVPCPCGYLELWESVLSKYHSENIS